MQVDNKHEMRAVTSQEKANQSCFPSLIKGKLVYGGAVLQKGQVSLELKTAKQSQIQSTIRSVYCTQSRRHHKLVM